MKMKNKIDFQLFILNYLQDKSPANVNDIANALGYKPITPANRRAIQRALKSLIIQNEIISEGKARANIYRLKRTEIAKSQPHRESPDAPQDYFRNISLSTHSKKLLQKVLSPIQAREHVSYVSDFLFSYEPNHTYYLDSKLRSELHSAGNAEPTTRPAGTYARNILDRLLIDLSWNSSRLEGQISP